jgi:hypothetical protein
MRHLKSFRIFENKQDLFSIKSDLHNSLNNYVHKKVDNKNLLVAGDVYKVKDGWKENMLTIYNTKLENPNMSDDDYEFLDCIVSNGMIVLPDYEDHAGKLDLENLRKVGLKTNKWPVDKLQDFVKWIVESSPICIDARSGF